MRMFRKQSSKTYRTRADLPSGPVVFPSGIAVKTEKGAYFIHKDGRRYRIQSKQILDSWRFPLIVDASESSLSNYPVAVTKLAFRDGSLLHNIKDGKLYLVSEARLRHITSPDVLERLGVTRDDAMLVADSDIAIMKFGEEIS